jgi:hypothetical protein
MIEKLNRVFEKLPPEHRDIIREAFTILIEEVINAIVREIRDGFEKQEKENERIWQNIEKIWQAIDRLTNAIEKMEKTFNERFERQEKENERIWQAIKEGFEKQAKENEKIWQAIKEGFERQEKENQRIWQNIERVWQSIEKLENTMKEGFERQEKENQRIWQAIEELRKDMKEGFERQEKENQRIWQNIERVWQSIEKLENTMKEGFERQEKENQRIWQAIEEDRKANQKHFKRLDMKLTALGARWGLMAEETFRAGLKTIIEDLGYVVENVVFFDDEGYVFLKPSRIEIDIIIKDGRKIAVEIKSSVSDGDVITFERKVRLYEKKFNIKIDKKIILTPFASSKAIEIAKSLDIEIVEELKE